MTRRVFYTETGRPVVIEERGGCCGCLTLIFAVIGFGWLIGLWG